MSLRWSRALSLLAGQGALAVALAAGLWPVSRADAFSIELKDVAADRIDRQRAHGYGEIPLPGTPDVTRLDERLALKGLTLGSPIYIRVYKEESELEVWMLKGDQFVLLDTYPICHWSGTLGPKMREGDAQAPEGVYTVSERQIRLRGRWQRAFNLGFPNPLDQIHSRTGSFILIHGGCSSVGCFAMTNPVIEEIYKLASAALTRQQERFHVHVFPFRMTAANMARHQDSEWRDFWANLKEVHDVFERTRRLPRIGICEQRYLVDEGRPGEFGNENPYRVFSRCVTSYIAQGPTISEDGSDAPAADPAPAAIDAVLAPVAAPKAVALPVPPVPADPTQVLPAAPAPAAPPIDGGPLQPKVLPPSMAPRADAPAARPATAKAVPKSDTVPHRPVQRPRAPAPDPEGTAAPRDPNELLGNYRGG